MSDIEVGDPVYADLDQEHAQGLYLGSRPPEGYSQTPVHWILDINQYLLQDVVEIVTVDEVRPCSLEPNLHKLLNNSEAVQKTIKEYRQITEEEPQIPLLSL